jgi:hypothetical protein
VDSALYSRGAAWKKKQSRNGCLINQMTKSHTQRM